MAAWRRAIELSLGDADVEKLRSIAQSRTEPASRVERSRTLLGYWKDSSFFAVGQALGLHHQTVQRCVERAVAEGAHGRAGRLALALAGSRDDHFVEAKTWVTSLACRKAKDLGYPHRIVDDATSGPPRTRARTGGGARVPCQLGARYGVQDTRPGGGETAQGAVLLGVPRPPSLRKRWPKCCAFIAR